LSSDCLCIQESYQINNALRFPVDYQTSKAN
jgi:hypothetical protein